MLSLQLSCGLFLPGITEGDYELPLRQRGGPVYRPLCDIVKLIARFSRRIRQHLVRSLFERLASQFPGIQKVAVCLFMKSGLAIRGQCEKGCICLERQGGTDLLGELIEEKGCPDRADHLAALLHGDRDHSRTLSGAFADDKIAHDFVIIFRCIDEKSPLIQ